MRIGEGRLYAVCFWSVNFVFACVIVASLITQCEGVMPRPKIIGSTVQGAGAASSSNFLSKRRDFDRVKSRSISAEEEARAFRRRVRDAMDAIERRRDPHGPAREDIT